MNHLITITARATQSLLHLRWNPATLATGLSLKMDCKIVGEALRKREYMDNIIWATKGQLPSDSSASRSLVRVEPPDPAWRVMRTELLSNHIAGLVLERIHLIMAAALSETLMKHLADPYTRSKAGILFEHAAHFAIRKAITLSMIRL
jgi:hypothetical protein